MIARMLLVASTVALLSQVISAANSEQYDKIMESAKKARKTADAKSEAASAALVKSNEASEDLGNKYSIFFEAMRTKFSLDAEKLDLNDEVAKAERDLAAKEAAAKAAPADINLAGAREAAKVALIEVKTKRDLLGEKIKMAVAGVTKSEEEFVAAQTKAQNLKKEFEDLKKAAEIAESYAVQLETTVAATGLVSSAPVTQKPNWSSLTPEEKIIIRMYLEKLKTETSTKPPTVLGNIVRAWAKVNLGIAESLDRMKASIRGVIRPNANKNALMN